MTPKKDIIRKPVYTLPDGFPLDPSCLGPNFTPKETAFILWYTMPETEAFLNAGRAASRAGYKPENAVTQGYLLRRKPRIAEKIESRMVSVDIGLRETIYRILNLSRIRFSWSITDFYRSIPCKRKIGDCEFDTWKPEAIPLNELEWPQRMCIDGLEFKGPDSELFYKLPDRDRAFKQFLQCAMLLAPDMFQESPLLQAMAAVYKVKTQVKGLKGMAAYLRGRIKKRLFFLDTSS
jgi:hypothetical protein